MGKHEVSHQHRSGHQIGRLQPQRQLQQAMEPEAHFMRGAVHLVLPLVHDGQRGIARQAAVQLLQRCLELLVPTYQYRKTEEQSPLGRRGVGGVLSVS